MRFGIGKCLSDMHICLQIWFPMKNENFVFLKLRKTKNRFSSKILPFLMIFQNSIVLSACSTLKNLAKNEKKPCPEINTSQKLKFSAAKLFEKNAILTNFSVGFFFSFFFLFREKWLKIVNAKKIETIIVVIYFYMVWTLHYARHWVSKNLDSLLQAPEKVD